VSGSATDVAATDAVVLPRLPRFSQLPGGALGLEALGLLIGAIAWELVGLANVSQFLPPLHSVVARIGSLIANGQLESPLFSSLENLLIGFAVSVVGGVLIGTAMAVSRYVDYALRVYVNFLMAVPSVLLVPVLYEIFGLSSFTLIAVIVLYSSVFIVANTRTAVMSARADLTDMARVFGTPPVRRFFTITLRSAGPEIFGGLRVGMGRAVKGMFNGELLIAVVGLAQLDRTYAGAFDATGILAIALVILVIAVALAAIVEVINRALNGWAMTHGRH
jgi:ABC-type nitrate/sulfonate/bicarbonate transport system permease component